jgi:release factor glutamine methyltransferase
MQVNKCLERASGNLEQAGVATARLDSLVLLEDLTRKDRGWLLAHPEYNLGKSEAKKLFEQIERRANHEPLAYIRGKCEFYGHEFLVTPATLQPRSETETMIDLLKNIDVKDPVIVDIGTGSGCLAITTKLLWPRTSVYATEINADALKVAKQNAKRLNADVTFYKGNLLEPAFTALTSSSILLCNLPYVPDSHTINQAAMQEPRVAIFGGEDGLDLYRELFAQTIELKERPELILTECLPFQHKSLAFIARKCGYKLDAKDDFIQVFRSV